MDRVWSETQQLQSPQHTLETANGGSTCKVECPSPVSRPESPTGPSGPEAVPSTFSATVTEVEPGEGLTVIRTLTTEEENHQPEDHDLVYQNLSGFPTTGGNTYNSYGITYVPLANNNNCSAVSAPYNKIGPYDIGNSSVSNTVLSQGYDSPQHSLVHPSTPPTSGCTSLHYGSPLPYPQLSHSPVQGTSQPMWSAIGNLGTQYSLVTDLGSAGTIDSTDVNRGYMYSNAPYIPSGHSQTGDALWTAYADKNQPLPSMTSLNYLQDGRRNVYTEPQDFLRISDQLMPHQCALCGTTEGGSWRRDTAGQFLCSNCGVYKNSHRSSSGLRPQKRLSTSRRVGMTCSNCSTNDTTLWRRNGQGEPVCNACGLYYKLHQVNRPISMRKDSIQTRKRKPKSNGLSRTRGSNSAANGSNRNKSPATQTSVVGEPPAYMPQGTSESSGNVQQHSPTSQRNVSSPVLPSSAVLSQQQLQHITPLDPPQQDPGTYLLSHGLDGHSSVISINHKIVTSLNNL